MNKEKRKTKFFENRPAAIAILIAVAVLAVPLLGGLRLALAYRSAEKTFEKAVAVPDAHGNDLYSDTDRMIVAAKSLLAEGKKISGDDMAFDTEQRQERLLAAISATENASSAVERYTSCEKILSEAQLFYNSLRGSTTDSLDSFLADLNSQNARIERVYRHAYSDFTSSADSLTQGFPASVIAKLFGIGGGN